MPSPPARQMPAIWNVWVWIAFAMIFWGLSQADDNVPLAPLKNIDLVLYAAIAMGLLLRRGNGYLWQLPPVIAAVAYCVMSWGFGMVYEASLTVDGRGIGGVHPQTQASYILAQGDYVLIAIVSWYVIRRYHLTFSEAFFFAGGKSLTEGFIFTGVLANLLATMQWYAAPFMLAYYTLAYASFIALPLLILDPRTLWSQQPPAQKPSIIVLWFIGAVLAFGIRVIWGLAWAPFATWAFQLPPNIN